MRLFLERWRKKYKKSVKHYFVTELGGNYTERIHLHGIMWTTKEQVKDIQKIWGYGYVHIGIDVSEKTVNYITKYMNKTDEKHKNYKGIILTSPGIGKNYINRQDSKLNKYKENGKTNKQHNQNRHKKQHKDKPQKPMYNPNKEQLQQNKVFLLT